MARAVALEEVGGVGKKQLPVQPTEEPNTKVPLDLFGATMRIILGGTVSEQLPREITAALQQLSATPRKPPN